MSAQWFITTFGCQRGPVTIIFCRLDLHRLQCTLHEMQFISWFSPSCRGLLGPKRVDLSPCNFSLVRGRGWRGSSTTGLSGATAVRHGTCGQASRFWHCSYGRIEGRTARGANQERTKARAKASDCPLRQQLVRISQA